MSEYDHDLIGKQRKHLRGLAHGLKPVVRLGREGFTRSVQDHLDRELGRHELVKIRFLSHRDTKRDILDTITRRLSCSLVGLIGHVAILYRAAERETDRQITLPSPDSQEP